MNSELWQDNKKRRLPVKYYVWEGKFNILLVKQRGEYLVQTFIAIGMHNQKVNVLQLKSAMEGKMNFRVY